MNQHIEDENKKYIQKGKELGKDWKNYSVGFFCIILVLIFVLIVSKMM